MERLLFRLKAIEKGWKSNAIIAPMILGAEKIVKERLGKSLSKEQKECFT
ncbi:MAG: hypothetical protein K0A99_06995 [Desulfoarculaceae bacterium]|nr:hypothetical protein [Desulfoarculaceae bacterium]